MGMRLSIYMGAYLLVPFVEQSYPQEAYACSAGCGQPVDRRARFCSACGAVVVRSDKVIQKRGPLRPGSVLNGAYEDAFWTPEGGVGQTKSLWLPNQRGYGDAVPQDCDPDLLQDLDPQYFAQSKEAIQRDFAHLLSHLQVQYGVSAQIQAGVLSYWS